MDQKLDQNINYSSYICPNNIYLYHHMTIFEVRNIVIGFCLIVLSGCGGYNKVLKSTDNELKYNAALKYYNKNDYSRATPLFEALKLPFEGTERDDTVSFYFARGNFMLNDYELADYYLNQFCRTFARSKFAEEAFYLKAVNLERMSLRYELDQENTIRAIAAFNEFETRYPNSTFEKKSKYLDELENRLEKKSFYSAKLYYQIEDYKAAIVALRNSVKDYPESPYKEEQMFLILRSSYMYAKHSVRRKQASRYIAAIDEYYNFMSEFPASSYKSEAESIYNEALSYTKKRGIEVVSPNSTESE